MSIRVPLTDVVDTILDGSGNGRVKWRPDGSRQFGHPDIVSVTVSAADPTIGPLAEAVCKIYAGSAAIDSNIIDGTFTGSSGNSSDRARGHIIGRTREAYLWAVWTGGDPGQTATMTVTGELEIPG